MAIQVRQATAGNAGGATSFTPALPSGWLPGDIVFIHIRVGATTQTVSQTAGTGTWTFQYNADNTPGGYHYATAWRVLSGSDTAPTFSWSASNAVVWAQIGLFSDASGTLAPDVWATELDTSTSGNSVTANAATGTSSYKEASVILTVARAATETVPTSFTYTQASGWTQGADNWTGTANSRFGAVDYQLGVSGTVTPGSESLTDNSSGAYFFSVAHVLVSETPPPPIPPHSGGRQWQRLFRHRQQLLPVSITVPAAPPTRQPLAPLAPARPGPHRARLGGLGACAAGILAVTALVPHPLRPQPAIAHPAPHRAIAKGNLAYAPPFTVVQSVIGDAASLTSLTLNLPNPTRQGDTLVVEVTTNGSTGSPQVSSITLGGSADHFAQVVATVPAAGFGGAIWYDPNCLGGQTSVAITCTGGSGTSGAVYASVYEVAGVLSADQSSANVTTSAGTTWTSGTTPAVRFTPEIAFGMATATGAVPTVTGSVWATIADSGGQFDQISGYQYLTGGVTEQFSGTIPSGTYVAGVATFFAATQPPSRPLPVIRHPAPHRFTWDVLAGAPPAAVAPAVSKPALPQQPVRRPGPHRAIAKGSLAPPQPALNAAKLPPTAISPRPAHRAVSKWLAAKTTLSPQPAFVPPALPAPVIRHPAPHRAITGSILGRPAPLAPPARPQPAIAHPAPHRAVIVPHGIAAKTTLSPQPSAVPAPLWRQPNAPRPSHRAIWRAVAGPPPPVITVTGVPPARPRPVTNRPPAPHRAVFSVIPYPWAPPGCTYGSGTYGSGPYGMCPSGPASRPLPPFAPRPAHRLLWRVVAGPAPQAVVVAAVVPARPQPVTNRFVAPHRAVVRGILAKTTLSAQPAAVPAPHWAPQPRTRFPHRAVPVAGGVLAPPPRLAPPSRPAPTVNRPPAPHRAVVHGVLAKTTLSAQPLRVPGPQWRQPFAPRPPHRAAWRQIAGPPPPPPFLQVAHGPSTVTDPRDSTHTLAGQPPGASVAGQPGGAATGGNPPGASVSDPRDSTKTVS